MTLLASSHSLRLILRDLLDRRPFHEPLVPSEVVGVVLLNLQLASLLTHDEWDHHVPGQEREIGDGAFLADEVLLALESHVEDVEDALDLVEVALSWAGEALWVEVGEPCALTVVWT